MRIIAGQWKGMHLMAPPGVVARPTTDRVKEAMFNLLGIAWPGGAAVDLFTGSGALGLEALSRGASHAYLMDVSQTSMRAATENVQRCKAETRVSLWRTDWRAGWQRIVAADSPVGWVFADPPYRLDLWDDVLSTIGATPGNLMSGVVCEHPAGRSLAEQYGRLLRWKSKRYGDIALSLYRCSEAAMSASAESTEQ